VFSSVGLGAKSATGRSRDERRKGQRKADRESSRESSLRERNGGHVDGGGQPGERADRTRRTFSQVSSRPDGDNQRSDLQGSG
jgi:hypothetical protein